MQLACSMQSAIFECTCTSNMHMAALAVEEPEAKRLCTTTVKLRPVSSVNKLRERYTEDNADVVFVDQETTKRLPAHREVLKVASDVFFRTFSGDWKESVEKEIKAPKEYRWESFKAVIALVYGEEIEVEEATIPDIYGLAHLYDFREVTAMLGSAIRQWDSHLLETVVKLCVLAQDRPETGTGIGLLHPTLQYIARHLEQVQAQSVDIAHLSYHTMLMLVQSEDVTSAELVLLQVLNQWTNEHSDISLKQAKQLYFHIRFGTIPFESLTECIAATGHEHLELAVLNRQQLTIDRVRVNVLQVTPRMSQKEVFKVYPMATGFALSRPEGKYRYSHISFSPAVAVMYSNREDLEFEITHTVDVSVDTSYESYGHIRSHAFDMSVDTSYECYGHTRTVPCLVCELSSMTVVEETKTVKVDLREHDHLLRNASKAAMIFRRIRVTLSGAGACLNFHPDLESYESVIDKTVFKTVDLPYSRPFPWLMTFSVDKGNDYSFEFTHPIVPKDQ